jgi:general secretion pathway protein D
VPTPTAGTVGQEPSNLSPEQLSDLGPYITRVVQLNYVKPSEVMPAITPFASAGQAGIVSIESSQILVLRDYTENVKRMLEMIRKIDISVPMEFTNEVVMIKYAQASDIASALNSLSTGGGGASVGSSGARTGAARGSAFGANRMGTGVSGSPMGGVNPYGGNTGVTTPGATTPGGTASSSFTDRLRNIMNQVSSSGEIQILGKTKIIADERTNSLLIYATREDMRTIKELIAKLDVVLAQVLIEAVIIEVNLNNSFNLAVSANEMQPHGVGNYFNGMGAINNGNALSQSPLASATTNIANTLGGGFSYLASFGNDLDVTLTALAANSRATILQRPRIQTSHGVPAQLFVGESVPYPTGSYYGGGAYGGYSSIQQMQIGVSLEVTPLINPDGLVVMDIHQKIDSVSGTVNIANVGDVPITSSKEASAKVAVRDHDTIMLGGLIETDKSTSFSGVPLLKDIPFLGALFRSDSRTGARTELVVLIRPTVLPSPEVAALAAKAEKNKMPEVRRVESEDRREETRRLKQLDKADRSSKEME